MSNADRDVRETLHSLSNALAAVLSSAELILAEPGCAGQIAEDARTIRSAALRARTSLGDLRRQLDLG